MNFGIMFFSSAASATPSDKYRLLIEAARYADRHDFCCVWTPERHFHEFGGLFPNPSVTNAALATITERLELRAGSLISPLHDPIRIAEEWSVVDNLSGGRVAISFGSGWNVDDFVFFPERYEERRAKMFEQIETVRSLWTGGEIEVRNSCGKEIRLSILPRPIQDRLPVWITSSGNPATFIQAGEMGANVLTHLIGQDIETLEKKITSYRKARRQKGFDPQAGTVSLMLHTFLGSDVESVKATAREPFRRYLKTAVSLERMAAIGGGDISGGHRVDPHEISPAVMAELLDITYERYSETAALLGTPESCADLVRRLEQAGVDEIACLIDFGVDESSVLAGLEHLNRLRESFSAKALDRETEFAVQTFMEDFEE